MKENYLENSFHRLGTLWNQERSLGFDLEAEKEKRNMVLSKYKRPNNGALTKKDYLADTVVKRKQKVQSLLDEHNKKREEYWDYPLTLEDAIEDADAVIPEVSVVHGRITRNLELNATDREFCNKFDSAISAIDLKIKMVSFEISDILFELGLRGIEEDDLRAIKQSVTVRDLEKYKQLVGEIREKVAKKVAIVLAGMEDKKYIQLQEIPKSNIDDLAVPINRMLDKEDHESGDMLMAKVGEFDKRVDRIAGLVLNPAYSPADKKDALRTFREGISSIFDPGKVNFSLGDFLMLFKAMESSSVGQLLLDRFDLTELFDMSNPVVMLGVALHYSKNAVDHQKLYAVRRMMVGDESAMNKADWVKLFKMAEDIEVENDPEWQHFVGVMVKQFVNTAIYTAAKEGDYVEFQRGAELVDATLFSDHRPEERMVSERVVLDLDQIFSYLPDRVQLILEAVRDYNSTLFAEILMAFYENGLWFAAIKKGKIKYGLKHLWGKQTVKMSDLVERMLYKAGVYKNNSLSEFKELYYGLGVEPSIKEALAANAVEASNAIVKSGKVDDSEYGSRVATDIGANESEPAKPEIVKEGLDDGNPFDI